MIVVSDTGPINYLLLIGHIDVLEQLYVRVILPNAVYTELMQSGAPEAVVQWAENLPVWVEVRPVLKIDPTLALDPGEQEAITLAMEINANAILMDEKRGRAAASSRHLNVVGTLGILDAAASLNLIDLPEAINLLQNTTFRVDKNLVRNLLANDALRNKDAPYE